MPYIEDITGPLIHTLKYIGGLPVHQLAGHAANLDFWTGEVKHAFDVIDGYQQRFRNIHLGKQHYFERQQIAGKQSTGSSRPAPPLTRSTKDHEIKELRRRLADAMYHVLSRCYLEDLITEHQLDKSGETLQFDVREIKRAHTKRHGTTG